MLVCYHITNCCTNTITRLFSTQSCIHSLITFTFLLSLLQVRIFRIIDGAIKSTPLSIRRENANIISHCWMADEILLLGTEAGEILLIENNEYRGVVYPPQVPGGGTTTSGNNAAGNLEEMTPIYCLCTTPRGFVAGTVDGEVRFFVRTTETREMFQLEMKKSVTTDAMGKVYNVALDSDDTLIITTDLQQMYCINLSSLNQAKENDEIIDFENVLTTFHGPNIRGEANITGTFISSSFSLCCYCLISTMNRIMMSILTSYLLLPTLFYIYIYIYFSLLISLCLFHYTFIVMNIYIS